MFKIQYFGAAREWRPLVTAKSASSARANVAARRKESRQLSYRVLDKNEKVILFWPPYENEPDWDPKNLGPFDPNNEGILVPMLPAERKPTKRKTKAKAKQREISRKPRVVTFSTDPPTKKELAALKRNLPKPMQPLVEEIVTDPSMSETMQQVMERRNEFSSPMAAMLAAVALDGQARKAMDDKLDDIFRDGYLDEPDALQADEIVVGAGLHAAIYCAVRVRSGFPKPLVLERKERVGGVFASSLEPSFYLNSRNRPGSLSIPGESGALNLLPGAPVQPADIGGEEFQTNDQLGWVIRMTLSMYADVVTNAPVTNVGKAGVVVEGEVVNGKRVIVATGLNNPDRRFPWDGERIMNFEQFMARMDSPFPLKGLKRVAVVGGGDSGKTAIEALTGKGPNRRLSVASLDFVGRIDWWGVKQANCEDWATANRSRYKGLASLLPSITSRREYRVEPRPKAATVQPGFATAYVNDVPYDLVVVCTGYQNNPTVQTGPREFFGGGTTRVLGQKTDYNAYVVGPAAQIAKGDYEDLRIPENQTALYRYAERTAALAAILPDPRSKSPLPF